MPTNASREYGVLLADDEPFIVRGLKKIIPWEELGFRIVGEASEGREAAALLEEKRPDIAVSDICMPGMSGLEMLRLVSLSKLPVKVIFISAHRDFAFAREAIALGAVDYLVKPLGVDDLKSALRRAVELIEKDALIAHGGPDEPPVPEEREAQARPDEPSDPRSADERQDIGLVPPGDWQLVTAFALVEREAARPASGVSSASAPPEPRRNLRLLRFAIINLVRRFSGPERGIAAAEREGAILVALGHGPDEDPAAFLELLRDSILAELKVGCAASRGPTVPASEAAASCEAALGGLLAAEAARPRGSEVAGIGRAIDHMESRFREELDLESVAAVACMNPYYFSALFKKRVGVNFKDYLSRLRAEEGRRLLLTTGLSCAEIAESSGFGDARRFAEAFKKRFGSGPAEYRAERRRLFPR